MRFSVEHWGIMSENPPALADWYKDVLGFSELFIPEGQSTPVFIRDEKGVVIEFFPMGPDFIFPEDGVRKNQHISLSISDFDEAVSYLESRGVIFKEEPFTIFSGGRVRFFQDPEGNWIHLIYRPEMPW